MTQLYAQPKTQLEQVYENAQDAFIRELQRLVSLDCKWNCTDTHHKEAERLRREVDFLGELVERQREARWRI